MREVNRKFIIVSLSLIIILGIIAGVLLVTKKNKTQDNSNYNYRGKSSKSFTVNDLTKKDQDVIGLDVDLKLEDKNLYSDDYKKYLDSSDEEKKNSEVVPEKYEVPYENLENIKKELNEEEIKIKIDELEINPETNQPYRFNLRDKIDIKINDQGMYGLCWAFASMNTLETHAALNNLGNFDFSEMHIDYLESNLMYGDRDLHDGGRFSNFKDYTSEFGVVSEEQVPYREHNEDEYNKFVDIPKTIEVTKTVDFPYMGKTQQMYDDPEEQRKYEEEYKEKEKEFRIAVKDHIMKNGGLYCSILATPNINLYIPPDDPTPFSNHAVTIVGWDDTYEKENFAAWNNGNTPKENGAYIAVNSWGEYRNDKGYFYISYEDKFVERFMSGIVSTSLDETVRLNSIDNIGIRNYLSEKYGHLLLDSNGEKYITKTLLGSITELDLSGRGLTSIRGINIFNNVYYLDLSDNNITDLSPLDGMLNLGHLDISNNNVSDLSTLNNIDVPNLYYIDAKNNHIRSLAFLSSFHINKELDYEEYIVVDVSGNKQITGFDQIASNNKIRVDLIASDCGLTQIPDISAAENITSVDFSKNNISSGIELLPKSISFINLNDNNISDISVLEGSKIGSLRLANNNISAVPKITVNSYSELDFSGNPITDMSFLGNLEISSFVPMEEFDEPYYGELDSGISLYLNNLNLSDISFINNISNKTELYLELKDNTSIDLGQLNEDTLSRITSIDLSGNNNIKGIEKLVNCQFLYLNNCGLSDISDITKLENLYTLDLGNNQIKDLSKISNLKNVSVLSLAGNVGLEGVINKTNLYTLNLQGCDIDDTFNFYNMPDLYCINLKNNPRLNKVSSLISQLAGNYISIFIDRVSYEDYEKISKMNKYAYLEGTSIDIHATAENGTLSFENMPALKKLLMHSLLDYRLTIENASMTKRGYVLTLDNPNVNNVKISIKAVYDNDDARTVFNVILDSNSQEEVNEETPSAAPSVMPSVAPRTTSTVIPTASNNPAGTEVPENTGGESPAPEVSPEVPSPSSPSLPDEPSPTDGD